MTVEEFVKEKKNEIEKDVAEYILSEIWFQEYNKECNYSQMTSKEYCEALHETLDKIAKKYDVDLMRDWYLGDEGDDEY